MVSALPGQGGEEGSVPSSALGGLWLEMSLWGRTPLPPPGHCSGHCEPGFRTELPRKDCPPVHPSPGAWPEVGVQDRPVTVGFSQMGSHPQRVA